MSLRLIQKRDEAGPNSRVCLHHFQSDCFERDLKAEMLGVRVSRKLKPDAIPDRQNVEIMDDEF